MVSRNWSTLSRMSIRSARYSSRLMVRSLRRMESRCRAVGFFTSIASASSVSRISANCSTRFSMLLIVYSKLFLFATIYIRGKSVLFARKKGVACEKKRQGAQRYPAASAGGRRAARSKPAGARRKAGARSLAEHPAGPKGRGARERWVIFLFCANIGKDGTILLVREMVWQRGCEAERSYAWGS